MNDRPAPAPPPRLRRWFWAVLFVLAGVTLLFEVTELDLRLQDRFYDFGQRRWVIDAADPVGRALCYDGPKALVWVAGLTALALAAGPAAWRERWGLDRRGLWLAVLTIATVPALAGLGKKISNTFCPSEIRRYGGDVPYVKLFEAFPEDDRPARRGGGFPAGHASGGFALMGLAWVRAGRRWRTGLILAGLGLGWWMGGYQMLKGAHYLSHTVTTMLLAGMTILVWRKVLRV
ncbi:MAG: phosphatase PAP2 family protein [Opitutaceae bacterium]|nr:phosphatase PAP2 family protein [Opitutaceae bacterium]